ncbi:MAG: LptF/LptG family permease [Bacteroidales bacterium]|jgi:lipopolysaccharide export system permease protein|nr:LptF/LptG family permease [Bacteroidales bacterium]
MKFPKIVDKYLLKMHIAPLILTFLVVLFVLLMQFIWKYIDDLVGKGLEWQIIMQLFGLMSFTFIPLSMPLAVLLSGLITYGNLAERSELTALKSAGIPLHRILTPLFVLSAALAVTTFFVANNVVPVISLKSQTLLSDIRAQKPALNIEEGTFYSGIENYVIRIGKKENDNQTVHDILIYDHSKSTGLATLTYAKRGTMKMSANKQFLLFSLEDGFLFDENVRFDPSVAVVNLPVLRGKFERQDIQFDLSSFQLQRTNEEFYRDHYEMLNVSQLSDYMDTMQTNLLNARHNLGDRMLKNLRYIYSYCTDTTLFKQPLDTARQTLPLTAEDKEKIYTHALQIARENASLLDFNILDTENQEKNLWRYENELHRKYVLSFACILLFFIGAPLGAIIRKGGLGFPMASSIIVFVIFWIIYSTGEHMARVGTIPSWLGMWSPIILLSPFAIVLVYKASVGSNFTSFGMFLDRLLQNKFIKKIIKKKKEN